MDFGLKGKYALVTGGSHGIGRSIALALADEGCNVAICATAWSKIEKVTDEIESKGVESLGIQADVLYENDIERVMQIISEKWGKLHILINNVGGGGRWGKENPLETEIKTWQEVYAKNAISAIRFTMKAIPMMLEQKWGRVITISSMYGREGGGRPWFNMAKSAEISLMKTLSMNKSFVREGITFNSVAPGFIMIPDTGWEKEQKDNAKKFHETVEESLPLGRLGTPEEVASVVIFLCSEKASLVNGACLSVDGGHSYSF